MTHTAECTGTLEENDNHTRAHHTLTEDRTHKLGESADT